ncbi:MAG: NAD(P)-dependent dehydrogenase (short-subunit alcohol dehydrogenase family) [Gammaproteobacteria bacterium]|jgi:NAD(P)-dependent dehydrogenase (short-subunit alcohol dehydrogenase family)
MENKQRTAIVTGGLHGIGLAIAKELSSQGVIVSIGARSVDDPTHCADAREAIGKQGVIAYLDLQKTSSVEKFLDTIMHQIGCPDILVNAAGVTHHHSISGHSDEDWDAVINTNLSGPFRMIRSCLPEMKKRHWGRIVNIASTAARVADSTHGAYCASKAGLVGLTKAVAMEGAPFGITCLSISPGWVETDMLRNSALTIAGRTGRSQAEEIAIMAAGNPQNRLVQPQEIAELAAFCCTDAAKGLTMEDIQLNAGALW